MEGIFQTDVQLGQTIYVMLNTFYGESIIKAQLYTKNGLERNNRISIFSSDFYYSSYYNMIEIPIVSDECESACELLFKIQNNDCDRNDINSNFVVISGEEPIKAFLNEKIEDFILIFQSISNSFK